MEFYESRGYHYSHFPSKPMFHVDGSPLLIDGVHIRSEDVEYYTKRFDGYTIRIEIYSNSAGGRKLIKILPDQDLAGSGKRYPDLDFFATGFDDMDSFEKRAPKLVKQLRKWAINTI